EALCDRIAFITSGRVEMIGEIAELRSLLQADEAHQIVAGGLTYAAIEALRAVPAVDSLKAIPLEGDRYQLEVRTQRDAAAVPAIVRQIVEKGGDVWSCGRRELTLEEMFTIIVEKSRRAAQRERVPA
ncbi:MAG: hypothetical protein HY874_03885, partial [Chloroflexi bacterium]|nr:hypothetical protein [Chloroflexota bacterium]